MLGERLSTLVPLAGLKLAAGAILLSPFIPLLFMGEEYGERAPFLYFISHSDPALVEAVRRGRREEFSAFRWQENFPDPQEEETFRASKLQRELRFQGHHRMLRAFYKELIRLRKTLAPLAFLSKEQMEIVSSEDEKTILLRRWKEEEEVFMVFNFSRSETRVDLPVPAGPWRKQFDSEDERWYGNGSWIPDPLQSSGTLRLSLKAQAFILFARMEKG
jgi:maltooligosyltrehalose trehalohydrolase